jgi:alpha-glucosidase
MRDVAVERSWARDAVIYEVYVRSFADGNGDGVGDLPGVTSRLDYLRDLGVDALWLTPFYRSPMADGGYDVADPRDVDPVFGKLSDVDTLVVEAHQRGLRVIIDLVPNHTSDQHPWFQAALAAGPGSVERSRYHFAGGGAEHSRDADGPPNNWQSVFHGPAWTRVADGQWYLHLFAPQQPDLNWDSPAVRDEYDSILRFWLDRGVDGVRIDVAHGLVKAPGLPDTAIGPTGLLEGTETPYWDQDGVHAIYRRWRSILDSYTPERIAVGEAWLPDAARTANYVRPGELHQAFNFEFLQTPWSGPAYRRSIDDSLSRMDAVGAPTTWVLSNHDVVRHATRLARGVGGTAGGVGAFVRVSTVDAERGLRRARAAILLMLALPGSVYLYQGEELGLPEVLDLPADARQDPIFARTGGAELGRDGSRVPLPWSGSSSPYGFSDGPQPPWLPQPPQWAALSVQAQQADPASTLNLYRQALRLRRDRPDLHTQPLTWHSPPDAELLVLSRGAFTCAVNLGSSEAKVSGVDGEPLVASAPISGATLPPDAAAWW